MSTDLKDRDTGVNPADSHFDDLFNRKRSAEDLSELEQATASEGHQPQSGVDSLSAKDQEQGAGWGWNNNVDSAAVDRAADAVGKVGGVKGKAAAAGIKAANRMFGPGAALLIASALMIFVVMGSGLIMPLQVVELFTNELSDSSAATQVRSARQLGGKIGRDMDMGTICKTVNLRCKFNTLSNKQIEKYRKAGFTVETSGEGMFGRSRISKIELTKYDDILPDGTLVTRKFTANNAKEFVNLTRTSSEFRDVARKVYNPSSASYFSKTIGKTFSKFRLSKAPKFNPDASTEENMRALNKQIGAAESAGIRDADGNIVDEEATKEPHKSDFDAEGSKARDPDVDTGKIQNGIDDINNPETPDNLDIDNAKNPDGSFKKIGDAASRAADSLCAAYDIPRMLSAGIKLAKLTKMMHFSMTIMTEVHRIKAGEDTDGKILRLIGEMMSSGIPGKTSLSESTSMQVAMTGSSPGITPGSEDFRLAGGGIAGLLDTYNEMTGKITSAIGSLSGGDGLADKTKGELVVRGVCITTETADLASTAIGIISGPAGWGMLALKVAINVARPIIISLLAGQAINLVIEKAAEMPLSADTTDGNLSDALYAGRAGIDNYTSQGYGLGPSTPEQIQEYTQFANKVNQHNIALAIEDAKDTPFDIYNEYSFVGMLARNINLSVGMSTSLQDRLASVASLIPSALSMTISPKTYAYYSQSQTPFDPNRYNPDNDQAVAGIGAAPDVFGTVRYSMTPRERNLDAESVLEYMVKNEYVDGETGEPLDNEQGRRFKLYQDYCVNREDLIGENSNGIGSIMDSGVAVGILTNPAEVMYEYIWQTGEACIKGQPKTADSRDTWIAAVDESYFVAEELRDHSVLTGLPAGKVASTESLIASEGDAGRTELEMFRVFTMEMALMDDLDGETYEDLAGATGPGGGTGSGSGQTGEVNPDGWAFPTTSDSSFTSGFGPRWGTQHQGVDLANSEGTPIFAARDGVVLASGPADGFGHWIVIQHDIDGQQVDTVYGHMYASGLFVGVGDTVKAGQEIAAIGNDGGSTGAHLHFEIWNGGRLAGGSPVDPAPILGLQQ